MIIVPQLLRKRIHLAGWSVGAHWDWGLVNSISTPNTKHTSNNALHPHTPRKHAHTHTASCRMCFPLGSHWRPGSPTSTVVQSPPAWAGCIRVRAHRQEKQEGETGKRGTREAQRFRRSAARQLHSVPNGETRAACNETDLSLQPRNDPSRQCFFVADVSGQNHNGCQAGCAEQLAHIPTDHILRAGCVCGDELAKHDP